MDARIVAKYLTSLKEKSGLTYEAIAEKCEMSEVTVKNLCLGKTEDPRLNTVLPVTYALGGSMDEMCNPGKSKDEVKEISINSIKEMYEQQLSEIRKTNEIHIENIRSHYEQHREDTITNYERLLKAERNQGNFFKILACIGLGILIGILILEVSNPNLGWIKF